MLANYNNLRMAAVLLARLDRQMADVLLARLSAVEARRVRAAVVELGEVSEDEAEDALAQLHRERPRLRDRRATPIDSAGLEIDDRLAHRLAGSIRDEAQFDIPSPAYASQSARSDDETGDETPFRFLHEARMDELAERLGREHPQAIAVVLAYLPPLRAAEALTALAEPVQVEVVRRLAAMQPADAIVVREIEEALRRWIAPAVESGKPSVGMTAAQRILSATSGTTQRLVLDALAQRDEALAEQLGRARNLPAENPFPRRRAEPPPPRYCDVERLANARLAELWRSLDRDVSILALAASPTEFVDRVLDALDQSEAESMCRDLDELGPVSLADLDAAQRDVAETAATMFGNATDTYAHSADHRDVAATAHGGVVV